MFTYHSLLRFVTKVDVVELGGSDELCKKGTDLTLFLFSDVLEISKRRRNQGKVGGLGARSPSTMSLRNTALANPNGPIGSTRPHRHVELMNLSSIRRVVDLVDGEECRDCFTLIWVNNEVKIKSGMVEAQHDYFHCFVL